MAYPKKVRSKKGRIYEYLAESTWVNGKSRQKYLGKSGESKVVRVYKENIAFREVGPIMADEIRRAELRWPQEWLLEAIKEAVLNNKLSWAYVVSICNRYEREGFSPSRREVVEGMRHGILPPEEKPASVAAPAETEPARGEVGLILKSNFKTYGREALISYFVICGYTWSQWSHLNPRVFHSLVIGLPAVDGKFQCCGLVGGGLRATGRREELEAVLKETEIEKSPFPDKEEILFTREHPRRSIAWVTMPMYQGLRRDLRLGDLSGILETLKASSLAYGAFDPAV
ncbi:hypothetical protein ES703_107441 [subsurface metagenome]